MENKSLKAFILIISLLVILLISFAHPFVSADTPLFPHNFYGKLSINGNPAPIGTHIKGMIGGVDKTFEGPYATDMSGQYGSKAFGNKFKVLGDSNGEEIIFSVEVSPGVYVDADQTALFYSGGDTELNLTVTYGVPTTSTTTTSTTSSSTTSSTTSSTSTSTSTTSTSLSSTTSTSSTSTSSTSTTSTTTTTTSTPTTIPCINITDMKVLNRTFDEVTKIVPGTMYHIRVSNKNTCVDPITSMQIIEVGKQSSPLTLINIGTLTSIIAPGSTSVVTIGFVLPNDLNAGDTFNATAFNWNRWIDQPSPPPFEILSETKSVTFQAAVD
jgi:hypothetical protein